MPSLMPLPIPIDDHAELKRRIGDTMAVVKQAREQQDDLRAALAEAELNTLLDQLQEASDAGSVK